MNQKPMANPQTRAASTTKVAAREAVLATAYGAHPERFPGGLPQPPACPTEVWINPPNAPVRPALRLAHEAPVA